MKLLLVSFSLRENGNCNRFLYYINEVLSRSDHTVESIRLTDHPIEGCGQCAYECFAQGSCIKHDTVSDLYDQCMSADKIIFILPVYRGHPASTYFQFTERGEGFFRLDTERDESYRKKVNLIVIGNITAGGETAMREAMSDFSDDEYSPQSLLLSSIEYGRRSINGDLIEDSRVRDKLEKFTDSILNQIDISC